MGKLNEVTNQDVFVFRLNEARSKVSSAISIANSNPDIRLSITEWVLLDQIESNLRTLTESK